MRNVIVTGGSRGLGLAIARRLADDGFTVIAVARRPTPELDEAVAAAGGRLHFHPQDLADLKTLPALVKTLRQRHGALYGLVNNAGIGTGGLLSTMPDGAIERLIQLNVTSPVTLTKHVVRGMMADGAAGGRIVNLGSIVAATGYSGLAAYAATKAAMTGFTKSLARELGRLNVTVNAIAPGFVDTEMTHGQSEAEQEKIARRSALKRMAEAEDVAAAAAFLVSDAARNITGTVMTVDAGATA